MYAPETYGAALVLMLTSMVCWGSWPNFLKKLPGWRLEYFYFDFSIGFLASALLLGLTLGTAPAGEAGFLDLLPQARLRETLMAMIGGFIWNIGNILLLNSIMIAGLAVAFPIAAMPAILIGIGVSYYLQPLGNPIVLGASVVLLLLAAQTTAAAYRRLSGAVTARPKGVITAIISGFLIGFFPPFVTAAITGGSALDSYSVSMLFTAGAFAATLVALPLLLRRPLIGQPGNLEDYLRGAPVAHALGLLAGAVWCIGTVFNFISAGMVGIAISVGIGSGAPMVGALWGVLMWREFASGSRGARILITIALALYAAGIVTMSLAYTVPTD